MIKKYILISMTAWLLESAGKVGAQPYHDTHVANSYVGQNSFLSEKADLELPPTQIL